MPSLHSPRVFDLGARAYDLLTDHGLWREQAARLLEPHPQPPPRRVLDIGCGPGMSALALADLLPGSALVGADLSVSMVRLARRHQRAPQRAHRTQRLRFLVADAARLPLADASFDLVTAHSFLYLVPDRAGVLRELRRVLRPGGTLRLMEPRAGGSLLGALTGAARRAPRLLRRPRETVLLGTSMCLWRLYSQAVGRLREDEAAELLGAAGFEEVRCAPTLGGLGLHLRAVTPAP